MWIWSGVCVGGGGGVNVQNLLFAATDAALVQPHGADEQANDKATPNMARR